MAKPQAAKVPAATVKELPPAEALKEQGNTALKQGKLQEVTPIILTLASDPASYTCIRELMLTTNQEDGNADMHALAALMIYCLVCIDCT